MSQPGISQFTRRVTRRQVAQAQQKQQLLDRDNSNIISLSDKTTVTPLSPRKSDSKPLHVTSPAKIRKTASLEVKKSTTTRGRKKEPSPAPRTRKGETIQAAFQRQLDVLKSPTKNPTTPDKFKLTPIDDLSPPVAEKTKVPTIRRALRFNEDAVPETAKTTAVIDDSIKPVMGGTVKRERAVNSQPNSPSTASPSVKKRNLFNTPTKVDELSAKEVFASPKKAPPSPLTSPTKLETRTRAQIMLEEIIGKKSTSMTKTMLKKQLEKSGKANALKAKLNDLKKINDELRQIGSPKKKSTIARAQGPTPTALAADAPCYVKYRHLAERGVMENMRLPAHYELLRQQYESNDQQVATLYNRGESCIFTKLAQAVKRILSKEFGTMQLEQIMAVTPESYQIQWKKGLYDAKKGSSRIKSSDYQLVLNPILVNDENDSGEGAVRMSLSHMKKRNISFRKTLLGIVKDLHEKFLVTLGVDVSSMKTLKRWHPQFQLEQCDIIKPAKIPQKPGTEDNALSAIELLEKMGDKLPEKAKAKLEARTKELEKVELEKLKKESENQSTETAAAAKKGIPAHILAKIKAKQAARAEEVAEDESLHKGEINLLERTPQAASILRSYFVTEKKSCFPFDSACKKVQRSWKVAISLDSIENMLTKVHELMPALFDIRVVVGVKYIKILNKKMDPNQIEKQCREKIVDLKN